MKYWIVPCNDSIFRISEAIQAQNGMVDWRMSNKFHDGDLVFIYKAKPDQRICYKMEVVVVGLDDETAFYQERFWTDKSVYFDGLGGYRYARFRLLEEFNDDVLSLHHLHEHGLRGYLQGVRDCTNEELLAFLLNPYENVNNDVFDVDYPADDEKLYEGALIKVMANKFERNQKARHLCVEKKGYRCIVCGFDFERVYGTVGKEFIHVHHLVPISSIGKEYELNVDTDLVPVCPNCHYMMHRKTPPYTVEEMQKKIQTIKYDHDEEQKGRLAADENKGLKDENK